MKPGGLDKFENACLRSWVEDVELFHVGVPAPLFIARHEPFGVLLLVFRTDIMGMRGKPDHIGVNSRRVRDPAEFSFPFQLGCRPSRGKSEKSGARCLLGG